MLYERKGFMQAVASIFIQKSNTYDYQKIAQKGFKEASFEDMKTVSSDFKRAIQNFIAENDIDVEMNKYQK
ncbi:hypothetical protein WMO13_04015 [Ignatzschineria larvae DSM 13226]|uniref:Uncharacterized protein n=1 Tax=Ignatzschineria larvae DSM 13226 TaxID=1111732 RepID=A0ABZ3C191_9GAMM|nr:hypothetical protein [Ignatzschineria larvae]